ncbi:MAG: hypothetical protein U1E05_26580 [Patescibacteria group bacterium]|nr:hypothetical protein [Patescibacteria group bacterium]
MRRPFAWTLLIMANVLCYCVLSLYQPGIAAQANAPDQIANPIQQRADMLGELQKIRELLKEQNELLSSGKLKVIVVEDAIRP